MDKYKQLCEGLERENLLYEKMVKQQKEYIDALEEQIKVLDGLNQGLVKDLKKTTDMLSKLR